MDQFLQALVFLASVGFFALWTYGFFRAFRVAQDASADADTAIGKLFIGLILLGCGFAMLLGTFCGGGLAVAGIISLLQSIGHLFQ